MRIWNLQTPRRYLGHLVGENEIPWPYVSLAFRQANSKADEPSKLNFFRLTYHFPPFPGRFEISSTRRMSAVLACVA